MRILRDWGAVLREYLFSGETLEPASAPMGLVFSHGFALCSWGPLVRAALDDDRAALEIDDGGVDLRRVVSAGRRFRAVSRQPVSAHTARLTRCSERSAEQQQLQSAYMLR